MQRRPGHDERTACGLPGNDGVGTLAPDDLGDGPEQVSADTVQLALPPYRIVVCPSQGAGLRLPGLPGDRILSVRVVWLEKSAGEPAKFEPQFKLNCRRVAGEHDEFGGRHH